MKTAKAVFVTSNEHKRREAAEILGIELASAAPEIPEIQALDVAEVAAAKALAAHEALGSPPHPVLVEDSGLVVEAWNGLPGALTKWFIRGVGSGGILRMLSPGEGRSARAVCAVAVAGAVAGAEPDGRVRVFEGEVPGMLAPEPRGESGFGWDPIFIPEGESRTYAQMGGAKHQDSHRARAFRAVGEWFEEVDKPEDPGN
ncbi:MAG: non-canonical purine NTP pyrophosphatase [Rubrobacteraceae bacterium]